MIIRQLRNTQVSVWSLFNVKWENVHQYYDENKLDFDEAMMMSTLYYT